MKKSVDGFLRSLPVDCDRSKINGVSCIVQFVINDVGKYILEFKNGSCAVVTGETTDPEITIVADEHSFVQWILGVGELEIKGDFSKIEPAFDRAVMMRRMMENIYKYANKRIIPN